MKTLTQDEITQHLSHLPGWLRQDRAIHKTYEFRDFARAMEFVNAVAEAAEAVNHHPDIDIRFRRVTLLLTTHSADGLTQNDTDFAASADGLADTIGAA